LVLHVLPSSRATIIADRYVYLSAIGFFLVVVYLVAQWYECRRGLGTKITVAGVSLYLLVLTGYTHERIQVWKNMDSLNTSIRPIIELKINQETVLPRSGRHLFKKEF
jgi:hypothetical protein